MLTEESKAELINIAKKYYPSNDPSHDWGHVQRVLKNAMYIAKNDKDCDTDILFAAVLFHDCINPPKHTPEASLASENSAKEAKKILNKIKILSKEKISQISYCISVCSFNKDIRPTTKEAQILQDSDMLEAVGAIAIMRTFCSTGQYGRPFYNEEDPFCEKRKPDPSKYAVDLFYQRLLIVIDRMNTSVGKDLAQERSKILYNFIDSLKVEIYK